MILVKRQRCLVIRQSTHHRDKHLDAVGETLHYERRNPDHGSNIATLRCHRDSNRSRYPRQANGGLDAHGSKRFSQRGRPFPLVCAE